MGFRLIIFEQLVVWVFFKVLFRIELVVSDNLEMILFFHCFL